MKNRILLVLILVLLFSSVNLMDADNKPAKKISKTDKVVKVIYYHGDKRCQTCTHIEKFSKGTMNTHYPNQLKSGLVKWGTVNFDKKENAKYMEKYSLYNQALIVSIIQNGKELKWKDCPEIWVHSGDKKDFESYVKKEVDKYLKEING